MLKLLGRYLWKLLVQLAASLAEKPKRSQQEFGSTSHTKLGGTNENTAKALTQPARQLEYESGEPFDRGPIKLRTTDETSYQASRPRPATFDGDSTRSAPSATRATQQGTAEHPIADASSTAYGDSQFPEPRSSSALPQDRPDPDDYITTPNPNQGHSAPPLAEGSGVTNGAAPDPDPTAREAVRQASQPEFRLGATADNTAAVTAATELTTADDDPLSANGLCPAEADTPTDADVASATTTGELPPPEDQTRSRSSPTRTHVSPHRYRPPRAAIPRSAEPAPPRPEREQSNNEEARPTLPIALRVRFNNRAGTCSVSLVPARAEGMPASVRVTDGSVNIDLFSVEDTWYLDIVVETGYHLEKGLNWISSPYPEFSWLLSPRELFVLGERAGMRGYVTEPRLLLGKDQVVLCTESILAPVEAVLNESGCDRYETLRSAQGAPDGWIVLRNIKPTRPILMSPTADILNVLRPAADLEIDFSDGVNFTRNVWLAGFPPSVRVLGAQDAEDVFIDGKRAVKQQDGSYRCEGWADIGPHIVSCQAGTKTYVIAEIRKTWDISLERNVTLRRLNGTRVVGICGPLVVSKADQDTDFQTALVVPVAEPVLIGQHPGDIYITPSPASNHVAQRLAWPPFTPVWALPENPLRANPNGTIHFLNDRAGIAALNPLPSLGDRPIDWQRIILDARRKRLRLAGETPELAELWRAYVKRARAIWKGTR